MKLTSFSRIALATVTLAAASAQAAPLQNGSFTAGLTNWNTVGDVAVVTGTAAGHDFGNTPTLVLGTASKTAQDDGETVAAGAYNVSGTSAAMAGQPAGAEANLGLGTDAFTSSQNAADAYEASSVAQSFFVNTGDTIRFTWQLLSRDSFAGSGDNATDSAWVSFRLATNPQLPGVVTQTKLGDIGTLAMSANPDGWMVSGLKTFSFTATTSGTARLGWGVADIADNAGTTLLAIQNVSVQSAVPEPGSVALLLAALGVIGLSTLRRRAG